MKLHILAFAIVLAAQHGSRAAEDHIPSGYKLLYEQKFEEPDALKQFQMTDANAWKYSKEEKGGALELAFPRVRGKAVLSGISLVPVAVEAPEPPPQPKPPAPPEPDNVAVTHLDAAAEGDGRLTVTATVRNYRGTPQSLAARLDSSGARR